MTPKNPESTREEKESNVLDVDGSPVENFSDTSKLGETSEDLSKKTVTERYIDKRRQEVEEKIKKGEPLTGADKVVLGKLGIEQPKTKEEHKKIGEKKEKKDQLKYPNTKAYFEHLLGNPEAKIEAGDNRLARLRLAKQEEINKGEGADRKKIEKINDDIHPIKQTYLKIINSLERGNALRAQKAISGQLEKLKKSVKTPEDLEKNEQYQKLKELLLEITPEKNIPSEEKKDDAKREKAPKKKRKTQKPEILETYESSIPETLTENLEIKKLETENHSIVKDSEAEKENLKRKEIQSLFDAKEEVESKLSRVEDEGEAKELKIKKQIFAEQIIKTASKLPEFKDIELEIANEKEKEWQKSIAISGYKTLDGYKKWHEQTYLIEIIKNSNLSDDQKEEILKEGGATNGNWFDPVKLNMEQVAVATKIGLDITKIKHLRWWNPFSEKIRAGENNFKNMEDFNIYLDKKRSELLIDVEIEKRVQQRKNEIIEKNSVPILDNKINKIIDKFKSDEKKSQAKPQERIKTMEESLKVFENKPEAKLEKLNYLQNIWTNAERIDKALKFDRVVNLGQEKIDPNLGADRARLLEMRGRLSDDIISTADQLQGRDLRKEFWDTKFKEKKIVSANPTKEERNLFRQEFREWITDQVKEIFTESIKEVEIATGKKVNPKSEFLRTLNSLKNDLEIYKPTEIIKSKKRNKGPTRKVDRLGVKKGARLKPLIRRDVQNIEE